MALTFVSWRLIQTERFGTLLSSRLGVIAKEEAGIELNFQRAEFGLFPITTKLINIKIKKDNYKLEAGSLSLVFGIRDLFAKKFSIGKIRLRESIIKIPRFEPRKDKESFDLKKYFKQYHDYMFNDAPVRLRGIELYNTNVKYSSHSNMIYALDVSFYKNIITTKVNASFEKGMIKEFIEVENTIPDFDGFSGEIQVTREHVRVKELKIFSETSYLKGATRILPNGKFSGGSINGFVELNKIKRIIPKDIVAPDLIPSGAVSFNLEFQESPGSPIFKGSFFGKKLYAGFYRADEVNGLISSDGKKVYIDKLDAKIKKGSLHVGTPFAFLDWSTGKAINPKLNVEFKNMYSNDFLFFVKGLNTAKFYTQGSLDVEFFDGHVTLKAKDNVYLKQFKLLTSDEVGTIVGHDNVKLKPEGTIDIQFDGRVNFDTSALFDNSRLNLLGYINGSEVNINVDNTWINFEELGPLVGTKIIGKGPINGKIKGPLDQVVFDLDIDQKGFELINFNLGSIIGEMKYHLDNQKMELSGVTGNYKSIKYDANGILIFDKELSNQMDFRINIKEGTLEDAKVALRPITEPLKTYLDHVNLNFSSVFHLQGKMTVPETKVKGRLLTSSVLIQNEDIDTIDGDFTLENNVIRWENVRAKKVSGRLEGESVYNLESKEFTYRFSLSTLRMKDVLYYRLMNLGMDGEVFGEFYGVGEDDSFSSRSHVRVTNSSIENYKLNDSVLTVYNNNTDYFFSGSLIGGDISLEGYVNLNENNKDKLSSITGKIKSKDIRILAGIMSQHNIFNKELKGELESSIQLDFDINNIESLNLKASLEKARLNYKRIDFTLNKKPTIVEIDNGVFKNWNYHFVGKGVDLESVGEGKLGEEFKLVHHFDIDSSILELVNDKVENAYGSLKGENIVVNNGSLRNYLTLQGESISLKVKKLPGLITNLKLDVSMDNDQVILNSMKGSYGNGEVVGKGLIRLKFPFPEIDMKLNIEKARYPLFKKSGIVVSGDLNFKGKKLPYDLTGNLAIISGEIIEETNDLASSAISNESYQRYIPVGYLEGNVSFMKNDIKVISFDPIRIKNSMMNLGLIGNMKIFGTLSNSKFNGDLSLSNTENKFLFKGHEFLLSEGVIHFVDGARKESPELRFSGTSKINEYDVYITVTGPADSLVVEMTSNPPLIQGDILSLLTLGVTSDVSKNLGERQRQSVTTLSIGSLIMDQLKINQSLNENLGLRLSVQPEFEEDGSTLLEGKTDDASTNSRLRSATVVKIQKRINKKVNLSVSSTVGGNIDQSQEMNINYKFNKSWSLEGIYEVKSNDELEQQVPDSAGADIKYQWSF